MMPKSTLPTDWPARPPSPYGKIAWHQPIAITQAQVGRALPMALLVVALLLASGLLSGCQSIKPAPVVSNNPAITQGIDTTTAHGLMQYTMLHRFDQSYDYQKTTTYQVESMYTAEDTEKNDHSIFLTLLQFFTGNNQYPKTRDISGPQLKCEDEFTRSYQAIVQSVGPTNQTQTNEKIATESAKYQQCIANHQLTVVPAASEKSEKAATYTTIDSITANNRDDSYAITAKKLITFFSILDHNIQQSNTQQPNQANPTKSDATTSTATPAKLNEQPSNEQRAPQKYPGATPPTSQTSETGEAPKPADISGVKKPYNLVEMLRNLRITPEQIQVLNEAYLSPKTITHQGNYNHLTGQFSSVLEERSDNPYHQTYKRIPMLVDFNAMSVTFETDVALPLASLLSDKELPATLAGKSIKFVLPENLRQNIPLPLLKATLIQSIGHAYGDIDAEKFNELKLDNYAKSIHAHRVIKLNLTPKDMGFVVGRTLKYWSQALKTIRTQHPEYINNSSNFSVTLDLLASANRLYRADDLAKLAQLAEAIIPLSYNSYNYYYFDRHNQLIGYRKIRDYQSGLLNARGQAVTVSNIQYHPTPNQTKRPVYYQPNPAEVIDGNALIEQLRSQKKLQNQAEDARLGYSDRPFDDTN